MVNIPEYHDNNNFWGILRRNYREARSLHNTVIIGICACLWVLIELLKY